MLDDGTAVSGLDTVDVLILPETDEIMVCGEGFHDWGEAIPYADFLSGVR